MNTSDVAKRVEARIKKEGVDDTAKPKNALAEVSSDFVMDCLNSNELGDGMLYAALNKHRFIFVKNVGEWYRWEQHYWQPDDLDTAISAVEDVALRYVAEIETMGVAIGEAMADSTDAGKSKQESLKMTMGKLYKRVTKLRSDNGRKNCLKFAHTNPVNGLAIHGARFDMDPWLLACANGVINLKKGTLQDGRQDQYISKYSPVDFNVKADSAPWVNALQAMFEDDLEIESYLQRLYGYGITGNINEEVFPVHFGAGRNGKSIIVEQIFNVMGSYAGPIPAEMLLDSGRGGAANATQPDILELKGLRIAVASETDEGRRFSASKVKWLTGKDKLVARGLYEKKLTKFKPTHLLLLLTNHKPDAPGTDFAFWDRCFLIKHKYRFVKRKPAADNERPADKNLEETLNKKENQEGILLWLVQGALAWQKHGLAPPESVLKATDEYQSDENIIEQFLESACDLGKSYKTGATVLYNAFKIWYLENINANERYLMSQKKFGGRFVSLERFDRKKVKGIFKYQGLKLNNEYAQKGDDTPF